MQEHHKTLLFFKTKQWFGVCFGITYKGFFAPFFDGGAFLELCSSLFGLYLIYLADGYVAMKAEMINAWAAHQAVIAVIPAFLIICIVRAACRTSKEIRKSGQWFGAKFVYHQPQLLANFEVTNADNDKPLPFNLHEVEIGTVIELKVERDGLDQYTKTQILPQKNCTLIPWHSFGYSQPDIGCYEVKNKEFYLYTHKDTMDPCYVKVYQLSFRVIL